MTVVLALDPGSSCGWALAAEGAKAPRYGTLQMPDVNGDIGAWVCEFRDTLIPFARLEGVTHVVAESPIIVQHQRLGGASTVNLREIEALVGMFVVAAGITSELGCPKIARAPRVSVISHFAAIKRGTPNYKRKHIKAAIVARCQLKGWTPKSEDAADALATIDWFTFDQQIRVGWDNRPAAAELFAAQPGVRPTDIKDPKARAFVERAVREAMAREGDS